MKDLKDILNEGFFDNVGVNHITEINKAFDAFYKTFHRCPKSNPPKWHIWINTFFANCPDLGKEVTLIIKSKDGVQLIYKRAIDRDREYAKAYDIRIREYPGGRIEKYDLPGANSLLYNDWVDLFHEDRAIRDFYNFEVRFKQDVIITK